MIVFRAQIFLIVALLLFGANNVSAQTFGENNFGDFESLFNSGQQTLQISGPQLNVNVTPTNPRPRQTVTISVSSPSFDINRSSISWYRNDVLVTSGVSESRLVLKTGKGGSEERIRITVKTIAGASIERTVVVRPADVLLVWQALGYSPPFYNGKTVHTAEGTVIIEAVPAIVESGVRVSNNNLVFTWKHDGIVLGSQSGAGKNILSLSGSVLSKDITVSVIVETLNDNIKAERSIRITPTAPTMHLYQNDPLLGVLFNTALTQTFKLSDEEVSIKAFPYFFTVGNRDIPRYEWRINNRIISNEQDSDVTLRKQGNSGQTSLSLKVENENQYLESAARSINIEFE